MIRKTLLALSLICLSVFTYAQNYGTISGNVQLDAQYYVADSAIEAYGTPQKLGANGFAEIKYNNRNFTAGLRYEIYMPPLVGFDPQYQGNGFPYLFANYNNDNVDVTVGNFYEQFGSGMILRAYEERNLGLDNSINGIRVKYRPYKGIDLTGLIGNQRFYWDKGPGMVRGFDANMMLNETFKSLENKELKLNIGGSFVSKYQDDQIILVRNETEKGRLMLPLNVGAGSGRVGANYKDFGFETEYVYKINDPNAINNYIYRPGQSLLATAKYATKGLGIILSGKRTDNMAYKSDRSQPGEMLYINYLPALTRQHTYALPAMYPYATQPNGEMAAQLDVLYTIPKKTLLGGKYGTEIKLNTSAINSIEKTYSSATEENSPKGTYGYDSKFFAVGDEVYFRDFNLGVAKKLNKSWKLAVEYVNLVYNKEVIEAHPGEGTVYANVFIADASYKINNKQALRLEVQYLSTEQDKGDWVYGLIEYSIAPHWVFAFSDMYNLGETKQNYYTLLMAYTHGANRFQIGYGKNREGITCAGGVCKYVPASSGLTLSIVSSF